MDGYALAQGNLITLRLLTTHYFQEYLSMFSEQIRSILHVTDIAAEERYLYDQLDNMQKGYTLFFCIFDNKDNQLIGAIEIRNNAQGQLYSWLNERYWGGGRYQEALKLSTAWYFLKTNAPFIIAHIDSTNKRSYHALRKFGCAHYGIRHGCYGKQYVLLVRNKR